MYVRGRAEDHHAALSFFSAQQFQRIVTYEKKKTYHNKMQE